MKLWDNGESPCRECKYEQAKWIDSPCKECLAHVAEEGEPDVAIKWEKKC